jgi:hypothetical protein
MPRGARRQADGHRAQFCRPIVFAAPVRNLPEHQNAVTGWRRRRLQGRVRLSSDWGKRSLLANVMLPIAIICIPLITPRAANSADLLIGPTLQKKILLRNCLSCIGAYASIPTCSCLNCSASRRPDTSRRLAFGGNAFAIYGSSLGSYCDRRRQWSDTDNPKKPAPVCDPLLERAIKAKMNEDALAATSPEAWGTRFH